MLEGRFSTITGCPNGPEIPCAVSLAAKSLPLPGREVMIRMGLLGKVWAPAEPTQRSTTLIIVALERRIFTDPPNKKAPRVPVIEESDNKGNRASVQADTGILHDLS